MANPVFFLVFLLLVPLCHGYDPLFEPHLPVPQVLGTGNSGKSGVSSLTIMSWMMTDHSGFALWQAGWPFAGYFGFGDSRLTVQKAYLAKVLVMPSIETGLVETILCLESANHTINPLSSNCRSLPADGCGLIVSREHEVAGGKPAHLFFPYPCDLSFTGTSVNLYPRPCENEFCPSWEKSWEKSWRKSSQKITFDFTQAEVPDEFLWRYKYSTHIPWQIYQTTDEQGQVVYYCYDRQGNRHNISQQAYWLILSRLFESLMCRLYPEIFGPALPAGGGWHLLSYTGKSKPAGRQAGGRGKGKERKGRGQPPARGRGNSLCKERSDSHPVQWSVASQSSTRTVGGSWKPVAVQNAGAADTIASLMQEFKKGELQEVAIKFKQRYNGIKHSVFCNRIKGVTVKRKSPLTLEEKKQLQPFVTHLTGVVSTSQFQSRSLSTCIHSLTSSQLLYLSVRIDDRDLAEDIETLTKALLSKVAKVRNFDSQGVANVLWALARLVDNGLNQEETTDAVTALLPQVVHKAQETNPQAGLSSQGVANLIWGLAKLVNNGLNLKLVNVAVMELLPLVELIAQEMQETSPQAGLTSQEIANVLWGLAKLVGNGLNLEQVNNAVTALLPLVEQVAQSASPETGFNPLEVSSLLWALAKLVDKELNQGDTNKAVMTLLPLVVQMAQGRPPQAGFTYQGVANLLWALARLVDNGLNLKLVNEAVTALLPQVIRGASTQVKFTFQGIANLLWALTKLMEKGFDQEQVNEAVAALLPHVVRMAQEMKHQAGFKPRGIANLLWSIAFLGEYINLETIESVLTSFSFDEQYSVLSQIRMLWSFMVFMARGVSMSEQLILLMQFWYQALAQQEMDKQLAPLLSIALRVDIKQYMLWRKGFRVGWQSCGAIMPHAMYPCSPQNPFWDS